MTIMKSLFVLIFSVVFVMGCSNNSESPKPLNASEPSGQSLGGEATSICANPLITQLNGMSIGGGECQAGPITTKNFGNRITLEETVACSDGRYECEVLFGTYGSVAGIFNAAKTIALNEKPSGNCCLVALRFAQFPSTYPHLCGKSPLQPCCQGDTKIHFEADYMCGGGSHTE